MVFAAVIPSTMAVDTDRIEGFDKGPSYKPVVPLKKTTFVNFDDETYLDDYAYLAAVPTSVFNGGDKLFSHPLLFYEEERDIDEEKELTTYAREGLDYFMEDWMSYSNGRLDKMTLINVPMNKLDDTWKAREYDVIESDTPYDIAARLALNEWSYSDDAVIAVIDEDFEDPDFTLTNEVEGILPARDVKKLPSFNLKQTNSLNPVFHSFEVGEGYKYLEADCWWDGVILAGAVMIPTGDPDLQLYCKEGDGWMQAAAVAAWNILAPIGHEYTQSHVYKSGSWRVGITDLPTEGEAPRRNILGGLLTIQGSALGALRKQVIYNVDITMYPGVDVPLEDNPPFGCRDIDFKLTWDTPNVNLGFSIIGPAGEAVFTMVNESRTDNQEVHFYSLGECLAGESYSVSVFAMDDVSNPVDFKIEYTWKQGISEEEGNSLTSATEGAVLASMLNAPLLYTPSSSLSDSTKDALYKLGVENIYLVNLGDHLAKGVLDEIDNIATITQSYGELGEIYDAIREITDSNDVVFTTIDPWTYWYMAKFEPAGEKEGALFVGPAAYIAAHHGTPVIIVDNHPRLSSAVTYHNELWRHFSANRYDGTPSSAEMVLTGRRIYDFLKEYGFDKEGDETIITVADQYDIGTPWDRIFPGVANAGRFCGTPVDISYWISRSMFYPALIFENPALQGETTLINGSSSYRGGLRGLLKKPLLNTLVINKESGEEKFNYPVLCSFVTNKYRFNERASKYYGATYQCADGLTPGESSTMEPIDQGTIKKYTGKDGAYFPDMSETEIVPLYLRRGGFDPVFSTQFEAVAENLNRGVILWLHASHGAHDKGGHTDFWDPQTGFQSHKLLKPFAGAVKETNPWRGYDWFLGSTEEPDTMSMDVKGIIPFTNRDSLIWPATGFDYVLARKPVREMLNKIIPLIDPFKVDNLYDGVTGSLFFTRWPIHVVYATEMDDVFGNLHSAGFITNICQTANTYFQLNLIRHGTVFQVEDPWATSWYATVWRQSIPRDIALGYTVGEAYTRGISHVGILYLGGGIEGGPQWWWDTAESVIYYGDPDLRLFTPSTEYSSNNYWEKADTESLRYDEECSIDGHMPFGATSYPHERQQLPFWQEYIVLTIALILLVILVIALLVIGIKKKR